MKSGLKAKTSASKFPAVDGGVYIWLYGTISAGRMVSFNLTTFIRSELESGSFEEDSGEISPNFGFEVSTGRLVKSSIFWILLFWSASSSENFRLFKRGGSWLIFNDSSTCFWINGDKTFPYLLVSSPGIISSLGWNVIGCLLTTLNVFCMFPEVEACEFDEVWSSVCGRLPSRLLFPDTSLLSCFGMWLMFLDFSCSVWTLRWVIGGFGTCRGENK